MTTIIKTRDLLLKELPKKMVIAEIGVFKGDFAKLIYNLLNPKQLHLIDLFQGKMTSGDKDGNNIEEVSLETCYKDLKHDFKKNLEVVLHKGKSEEILKKFPDNYFDFIYIDGDHSYQGVKKDLELAKQKVKLNGYIGGHDYTSNMFPDIVKAVDEFRGNQEFEFITNDGCPSFILKNLK